MGLAVRADVLAREVARRGWTLADLAKAAGLSGATMTAARAGRPISPRSLRRIAAALASAPRRASTISFSAEVGQSPASIVSKAS